jgi:methylase of polypeptide subunit release factors
MKSDSAPRPETASSVSHLLSKFRPAKQFTMPQEMSMLDLCCGTGCIALLSAYSFPYGPTGMKDFRVMGVDISPQAVKLSRYNQQQVLRHTSSVPARRTIANMKFVRADILSKNGIEISPRAAESLTEMLHRLEQRSWDILISNPPYISPQAFNRDTANSVRKFEPKLALVPPVPSTSLPFSDQDQGDLFYPRLLEIANLVSAKLFLTEVVDLAQAKRVASMAKQSGKWDGIEIWCDEPSLADEYERYEDIQVVGQGHGRSVFGWRGDAGLWLGKTK